MKDRKDAQGARALAVLAIVAVVALAAPAAQAAPRRTVPQASARLTLAGTVVLTGSRSGGIAVRLSRPASITVPPIALDPPPDARVVSRGGRFSGFVLHQDGAWDRPTVLGLLVRACTSPACTGPYRPFFYGSLNLGPRSQESGTLPAGDYHLYLVADEAPTTVTIRLHGLGGRISLPVRPTAGTTISAAKPELLVNPPAAGSVVYAGGITHQVTHWGALDIAQMWYLLPLPNEEVLEGDCHFYNTPPTPVIAYNDSPACQRTQFLTNLAQPVGQHTGPFGVFGDYGGGWIAGLIQPPGTWSDGEYANVAGPVKSIDQQQLIVNF